MWPCRVNTDMTEPLFFALEWDYCNEKPTLELPKVDVRRPVSPRKLHLSSYLITEKSKQSCSWCLGVFTPAVLDPQMCALWASGCMQNDITLTAHGLAFRSCVWECFSLQSITPIFHVAHPSDVICPLLLCIEPRLTYFITRLSWLWKTLHFLLIWWVSTLVTPCRRVPVEETVFKWQQRKNMTNALSLQVIYCTVQLAAVW